MSTTLEENATLDSLTNLLKQSTRYATETQQYSKIMAEAYQLFSQFDPDQQKILFSKLALEVNEIELEMIQKQFYHSNSERK